ncbi:hypothetical protein EON62_02980, partial [archaeon]
IFQLLTNMLCSARKSKLVFIAFSLLWRFGYVVAFMSDSINIDVYIMFVVLRTVVLPISIYVTLILDTRHWRELTSRAVAKMIETGTAWGDGFASPSALTDGSLSPTFVSASSPTVDDAPAPAAMLSVTVPEDASVPTVVVDGAPEADVALTTSLLSPAGGSANAGSARKNRTASQRVLDAATQLTRGRDVATIGGGDGAPRSKRATASVAMVKVGGAAAGAGYDDADAMHERTSLLARGAGGGSSRDAGAPVDAATKAMARLTHSAADLLIDFAELEVLHQLDTGGNAVVYAGRYRRHNVAIKTIRAIEWDEHAVQTVFREYSKCATLQHPNVVKYFGFAACVPDANLVFELCENGSLFLVLAKVAHLRAEFSHRYGDISTYLNCIGERLTTRAMQQPPDLPWRLRLRIALECAKGLQYLHEKRHMVHRDIKSPNYLVTANFTIKMSDFGSLVLERDILPEGYTHKFGTPNWMPPEVWKETLPYSYAVDIYSFGWVLWELLTYDYPFSTVTDDPRIIRSRICSGAPPHVPAGCPPAYARLVRACTRLNSSERPTVVDIITVLTELSRAAGEPTVEDIRYANWLMSLV